MVSLLGGLSMWMDIECRVWIVDRKEKFMGAIRG